MKNATRNVFFLYIGTNLQDLNRLVTIFLAFLVGFPCSFAQNKEKLSFYDRCAVKTNAFEWLVTVPNVAFEFDIVRNDFQKMSLNLGVKYNWNTYHSHAPSTVFDMFDVRPEFRYYFRTQNRKLAFPWWVMYAGPYVSYGTYTFKLAEKGIRGFASGVGVSAGYVIPVYEYKKGAIDVELGASVGLQVCTRDVFTHNPEGHYYTKLEESSKGLHVTPFPVISELRVAFVWRKQSIRYQVKVDTEAAERKERYQKYLKLMEEDIVANLPADLVEQYQTVEQLGKELSDRKEYLLGENAIRSPHYEFTPKTIKSLEKQVNRRVEELMREFERHNGKSVK